MEIPGKPSRTGVYSEIWDEPEQSHFEWMVFKMLDKPQNVKGFLNMRKEMCLVHKSHTVNLL